MIVACNSRSDAMLDAIERHRETIIIIHMFLDILSKALQHHPFCYLLAV